jgi:hypothetical protein
VFETIAFISTLVFFTIGTGLFLVNRQAAKDEKSSGGSSTQGK